ncbi:E3 ubiquitin-protein ligase SHPRH [Auxenochlorella protothecoides]|uniref:E3 ubiquitin-protein ligase SHPRH n=1 Tax=Auxenochlorella protothecoides TaxID=3075 RepID=A0A087SEY4_AUXPR|nr:E3 ubiquitin-protein ligase SHPRH [Auxenochlorella protothecoides]KFM24288.1 E3 ubiquitin-protein ligase SHPRH [Auxenochlorella protothecoides]
MGDTSPGETLPSSPAGFVTFRLLVDAERIPSFPSEKKLSVACLDNQVRLVTADGQVAASGSLKLRHGLTAVPRAVSWLVCDARVELGPPSLEWCDGAPPPNPAKRTRSGGSQAAAGARDPRLQLALLATVSVTLLPTFFDPAPGPEAAEATLVLMEHWLADMEAEPAEDGEDGNSWAFNPRARIFQLAHPGDWQAEQPQPEGLLCHLFRYQRRALRWMLWRESFRPGSESHSPDPDSVRSAVQSLGRLYQPTRLPGGQEVHYDALAGSVSAAPRDDAAPQVPGGLLCDEMGLGKTVEIIALILANPRPAAAPDAEKGVLPNGFSHRPAESASPPVDPGDPPPAPLASSPHADNQRMPGGTLVVCPPALVQQWRAELAAHAGPGVAVAVYDGLRGLAPLTPAESRQTVAQREAELYSRLAAGEAPWPSFSPEAEAGEAAAKLRAADVVLTTFEVLKQEVHYSPDNKLLGSLRYAKRYHVPVCPLLQIRWWRLVVDEAQMVGPLSAAGAMVERMSAAHRWCVTGTPLGGFHELDDLHGLLIALGHDPLGGSEAWRRLVRRRLAAGRGDLAWRALRDALLPLLWRSTKAVVAEEHALPPRSLAASRLAFQPGEAEFYGQLRLACTHPQLTRHWKNLQSDLQLTLGGTLSMEEIMQRLVDKAQFELQNLERALCATLNTLALVLVESVATRAGAEDASPGAVDGEVRVEVKREVKAGQLPPEGHPPPSAALGSGTAEPKSLTAAGGTVSASTQKRRRSVPGRLSADEARREAIKLLEQSFRVAEKGIEAADRPMEALAAMPDIPSDASATVHAWKLLQLNTAAQLASLYGAEGRTEDGAAMERDARDKAAYVRAAAEMEVTQVESRLAQTAGQYAGAARVLDSGWRAAVAAGFPRAWGLDLAPDPAAWLAGVRAAFAAEQAAEAAELEHQASAVEHMLGTRVQKLLAHLDTGLQGGLGALERHVNGALAEAQVARMQRTLASLTELSTEAELKAACESAMPVLSLLHDYQRRRIMSQWFYLLPAEAFGERPSTGAEDLPAVLDDEAAELRRLLAEQAAPFHAASAWMGAAAGYVFKLGEAGLGYYADTPVEAAPLYTPTLVKSCLQAVLRVATEHVKKLARGQAPEDMGLLSRLPLPACEARLEAMRSQVHLLRLLREEHVQEAALRLRRAQLADTDATLAAAAVDPPEKRAGPEVLRRRVESLKAEALELAARRRYMAGRAEEAKKALELPGLAGTDAAGTSADASAAGPTSQGTLGAGQAPGPQGPAGAQTSDAPPPSQAQRAPTAPALRGTECPICYEVIGEGEDVYVFGGCGHSFCKECSAQQVLQSGRCAVCRARVTGKQVFRVAASCTADVSATEACDPDARLHPTVAPVRGEWSIKITALLRRVLHLQETAPQEKSLVFSQHVAALDLVALALQTNGIKHVALVGGRGTVRKAIADFRDDDEVRVFLLSHRAGAAGLTLVRANHVFLLEPSLDPAIEQQAVARVHRIGQIRPVCVHRLLVGASIEEVVLARQEAKQALFVPGADPAGDAEEATTLETAARPETVGRAEVDNLLDEVL